MFEKSIDPLTKAISLAQYEPCYYHERAKCYLLTNQYEKSVEDFNQVIQLQPQNAHAYFGRAFALKSLDKFLEAATDFEEAKKLDPKNPKLIVNYQRIYNVNYIKLCNPGEESK